MRSDAAARGAHVTQRHTRALYHGRMTVMLAGGARTEAFRTIVDRFSALAADYAAGHDRERRRGPRIAVVVAASRPGSVLAEAERLLGGGVEIVPLVARLDADGTGEIVIGFDGQELLEADGVAVSEGSAAPLLAALEHRAGDLRRRVHEGMPFLGIGGGAAIAADRAITGGNEIGGVNVAPRGTARESSELTMAEGLGLVDLTIVPHAARHGRIGLGVAAIEAGLVDRAVAIDHDTALIVGEGGLEILGTGSVWQLTGTDDGVLVSTAQAAE